MSGYGESTIKAGMDKPDETLKIGRLYAPQLTWIEALAFFESQSPGNYRVIGLSSLAKWRISRFFASSITNVERALAYPSLKKITRNKNDNGFLASVSRFLNYVWMDATSTSSVVSATYAVSLLKREKDLEKSNVFYRGIGFLVVLLLKIPTVIFAIGTALLMIIPAIVAAAAYLLTFRDSAKALMGFIGSTFGNIYSALISYTNWNVFYPILVAVPGAVIKIVLASAALVSLPIVAVAWGIARVANALGFKDTNFKIMSSISVVIGIIATVPFSNLNPIFALKTLFFDPLTSIAVVSRFNKSEVDRMKEQKSEFTLDNPAVDRNTSISQLNVHKENNSEIIATFKTIKDGLRSDLVEDESKKISIGGYEMRQRKAMAWVLGKVINKDLVFDIRRSGTKNTIATIKLESGNNNNLKLQFTGRETLQDQDRITLSFTKMVLGIQDSATRSDVHKKLDLSSNGVADDSAPIKLDLSNSEVKSSFLIPNIPGRNKGGMLPTIDFVDKETVLAASAVETRIVDSGAEESRIESDDSFISIRKQAAIEAAKKAAKQAGKEAAQAGKEAAQAKELGVNPRDYRIS